MTGDRGTSTWAIEDGFDLDGFLSQPLVARLATHGRAGPTVRPLWYLWEERAFWWLTGGWSKLAGLLARDPRVALVVDTCDLDSGEVLQVIARGRAEVRPFDAERAPQAEPVPGAGRASLASLREWGLRRPDDAVRRPRAEDASSPRSVLLAGTTST